MTLEGVDAARSVVSLELEAANPETVVSEAARFGVLAEPVAPARGHGWPTYRYTARLDRMVIWLSDAYDDDGSGTRGAELVASALYPDAVPRLLEAYERLARSNRPDWLAFIEDAEQDPAGICYEMLEHARDIGARVTVDAVFEAGQEWVKRLRTACPRCGVAVVGGLSLSGPLEADGVVHECAVSS